LPNSRTPWLALVEDYDRVRDRIARVIDGFEDFNARVRTAGGFHLHHPNRERAFPTRDGKAHFFVHALKPLSRREQGWDEEPAERKTSSVAQEIAQAFAPIRTASTEQQGSPYPHPVFDRLLPQAEENAELLTLMTVRSHDQYNTTVYGLDDRYRGVHGLRRVCFISRGDLQRHGFADGDVVDLVSVWRDGSGSVQEREVHGFRLVEYDIPPGCLAAYFPETNPLVPLDSYAERARTPASKSIPVRLRRGVAAAP
jgi:anaerobic selenocysteine-containing dehydrogenase